MINEQKVQECEGKNPIRKSKMGYEFDINENSWELDNSTKISFTSILDCNKEFLLGFRMALCRYAEELSANMTKLVMERVALCLKFSKEDQITLKGIRKWRESLNGELEYKLGSIKAFLLAWHDWGIKGIKGEVIEYLLTLRLKGNIKGKSVKNRCPYSGPLTQQEQTALMSWATGAFQKSEITLSQYTLFLTLFFTGRRLIQVRSLRSRDLVVVKKDEKEQYFLLVPRVKQKGTSFRQKFKKIEIVKDLYLLLNAQIKSSQKQVKQHLNKNISESVLKEVPIFIDARRLKLTITLKEFESRLIKMPDFYHLNSRNASDSISYISRKCTARSERTGDFINFSSRRFRYTKGTNLSKKGIGGVYLAEALDHTDKQHIGIYVENTVETAEIIDEVMAPALAPLAQAFAGQLIDSERDAIRANDPHSRIRNDRASKIGNCGTHSFCANGYRSCYTCVNFQPWRDAPHSEVRDEILMERERQKEAGVSLHVIQATDRLLLAVEQVIQMCNQARGIAHG